MYVWRSEIIQEALKVIFVTSAKLQLYLRIFFGSLKCVKMELKSLICIINTFELSVVHRRKKENY